MSKKNVDVKGVVFGRETEFVLIGGPCVIESAEHARKHAEKIIEIVSRYKIPYVFKASFDKANRSSSRSFRGPGIDEGLKILQGIKKEFQVPVVSDVHSIEQIKPCAEVLDILQIPAFLCRQTDLLFAAAETGCAVNVKKGQFLSPWEAKNIVEKFEEIGCEKIMLTERGFSFGYRNLVSDFRSIQIMREYGYPVVFDATHSVQLPGGQGASSGGASEFIPMLARCALVAGADAIFMEIHENPEKALSDGPNAMHLSKLDQVLNELVIIKEAMNQAVGAKV